MNNKKSLVEFQLKRARVHKGRVVHHLKKLKKAYEEKLITEDHYLHKREEVIDGRTLEEWISFYDAYIETCLRALRG